MPNRFKLACLLMLSVASYSQTTPPKQNTPNSGASAKAGKVQTVTGCLTGSKQWYTVATTLDDLYQLQGDPALFHRYNAQEVRITGTVTPSKKERSSRDALDWQPPTLKVTKIEKVFDTCQ